MLCEGMPSDNEGARVFFYCELRYYYTQNVYVVYHWPHKTLYSYRSSALLTKQRGFSLPLAVPLLRS